MTNTMLEAVARVSDAFKDDKSVTPERLLTARELSEILGVHENYVYDAASRREIPSYKFGGCRRFRWSEIEAWLDNQRGRTYDPSAIDLGA